MRGLVCLLALVAGCGDNIALRDDEIDTALRTARCERFVRCGVFADMDYCTSYHSLAIGSRLGYQAAVDAGDMWVNHATLDACLAQLAALSCDQSTEEVRVPPTACNHLYRGLLAKGAACGFSDECGTGNCELPACMEACCLGTCGDPIVVPVAGESCAITSCAPGLFCDDIDICRPLIARSRSCDRTSQCDYGLACLGSTQTCQPLPHAGEPCPDGACAEIGTICLGGTCRAAGLPGDVCAAQSYCSYYYACGADLTCTEGPLRDMACQFGCADDSACIAGRCVERLANGVACHFNNDCTSDFCDWNRGRICADPPTCF